MWLKQHFISLIFTFGVSLHLVDNQHSQNTVQMANEEMYLTSVFSGNERFRTQNEDYVEEEFPDITPEPNSEYDFIIVGAGTAGCVLTRRLSEIEGVNILLIEAGNSENLYMDIPLQIDPLQKSSATNWKYQTSVSDKYCLGKVNGSCKFPRGKVLGGSSVLNYMVATRGHPADYDVWEQMGNDGWSYEDVFPYFKKIETMEIPKLAEDVYHHNIEGPIHISYAPYRTPLAEAFVEAGQELGYVYREDYNGEDMIGFSFLQFTISNGTRMSGNTAYLHPIRRVQNIHVTKNSLVNRLLFNTEKTRVTGVELTKGYDKIRAYARNEVIISAGAIGSAHILMLSGIGPTEHLISMGIDVVKDAPVGENLIDHPTLNIFSFFTNLSVPLNLPEVYNQSQPYITDFVNKRTGPFTIPAAMESVAFVDINDPKPNLHGLPSIEILLSSIALCSYSNNDNFFGVNRKIYDELCANIEEKHTWGMWVLLMKPKSRGFLRLKANDINVKPDIIPNYFDDPEDIDTMIKGIRFALNISRTSAMQTMGSRFYHRPLSYCEHFLYDSDAYWECFIRVLCTTGYHICGTCKMGPEYDSTAVVNPRLKVIGIEGLRIVDASIIPDIPTAHTTLPVYMIAEKAADMIKEDWNYSTKSIDKL